MSSRVASASNSGACTTPLKSRIALRTSSGFFCQNCDRNFGAVSPPSSCILIAAIIVCRCREPGEENVARTEDASLRQGQHPPDALQAGQAAPLFSLPDADMETVDLAQFRGKMNVVLYFYPRDGTPDCTLEATDFSDHEDEFSRHDCVVLGVSPDDCLSHAGLPRPARRFDPTARRHRERGLQEIRRGAREGSQRSGKVCITRSTFIIDKHGMVQARVLRSQSARPCRRGARAWSNRCGKPARASGASADAHRKNTVVSLDVGSVRHLGKRAAALRGAGAVSARRLRKHFSGGRDGARGQGRQGSRGGAARARGGVRRLRREPSQSRAAQPVSRGARGRHAFRRRGGR